MPTTTRLRLDLSYDGTDFSGWAEQPGRRTVAGELRAALRTLLRDDVPLVVAGRTDTGVHATGQVAHIDVDAAGLAALAPRGTRPGVETLSFQPPFHEHRPGIEGLIRRLAGVLPPDVRVRSATPAAPGFDARFGALRRHYRYRVATGRWGAEPLRRRDTYALGRRPEPAAMRAAAAMLLGVHDFAAYCRAPARPGATTIRELQSLRVDWSPDEPDVLILDVVADAFCHSMVRSIVGVLLDVGIARADVPRPGELLAAARRTGAIRTAPAHGLTLVQVDYPPDDQLADRVARTRAVRDSAP